MNEKTPMVSVVMAVYNAEKFLSQAIESILSQSFENFEFIIVDDGSTDTSWNIILKYKKTDDRIRSIQLEKNQGVAAASNAGLEVAKGKYIARMDSDDISLPDRLTKQVDFLESNSGVGILGGQMRYMNEAGKLLGVLPAIQDDLAIHWYFMFKSPFHNPTVMFRKSLLERYGLQYDATVRYGEDYGLWSRFLLITQGENLEQVLLYYRLRSQSLTHKYARKREQQVINTSAYAVQQSLPRVDISKQKIIELQKALRGFPPQAKKQRAQLLSIYLKIWDEFYFLHKQNLKIEQHKQKVLGDAAIWILYPFFQKNSLKAILELTKADWKWFFYFFKSFFAILQRRWTRH